MEEERKKKRGWIAKSPRLQDKFVVRDADTLIHNDEELLRDVIKRVPDPWRTRNYNKTTLLNKIDAEETNGWMWKFEKVKQLIYIKKKIA